MRLVITTGMPAALAAATCGASVAELTAAITIASTFWLVNCCNCEICAFTSICAEFHSTVAPFALATDSTPCLPDEMNELMS